MSERIPSAASVGIYYDHSTIQTSVASQHLHHTQQLQFRQTELLNAASDDSKSSAMSFMSPHQQHRMNNYHLPMAGYENCYPGTVAGTSSYAPGYIAYGSAQYKASGYATRLDQQQRQTYDSAYNNRPIDGDTAALGGHARFLPNQQHSLRGLYTPAGQQLIPSSVLHYPPRGTPPHIKALQNLHQHTQYAISQQHASLHPQHPLQHQHMVNMGERDEQLITCNNADGGSHTSQPPLQQQQPPKFMPQIQTQLNVSSPSPPFSTSFTSRPPSVDCGAPIPNMHYNQQQQRQQHSISATEASQQYQEKHNYPQHHLQQHQEQQQLFTQRLRVSADVSAAAVDVSAGKQDCREDEDEMITDGAISSVCSAPSSSRSTISAVSSPNAGIGVSSMIVAVPSNDCLTTSPPLISATGTDSGISSCSTRARSDSTQSTPIYSSEYPMSVGSSSGVSYHCADIKDFEEFGKDKDEMPVSGEATETLNEAEIKFSTELEEEVKSETTIDVVRHGTANDNAVMQRKLPVSNATGKEHKLENCESNSIADQSNITAYSPTNHSKTQGENSPRDVYDAIVHSPKNDTQTEELSLEQDQNSQGATSLYPVTESWSPLPESPGSSGQATQNSNHSSIQLLQQEDRELLSPVVPVPPHNSPVDYAANVASYQASVAESLAKGRIAIANRSASPTVSIMTTTSSVPFERSKKNRIMERDLIPSKKSKRKTIPNAPTLEEVGSDDTRDMTPLPGFQQAFGSTDIGRFFETFLHSPVDTSIDYYDSFESEKQQQREMYQHQQQREEHQYQFQQQLQMQQQQQQHIHMHNQQQQFAPEYLGGRPIENSFHQRLQQQQQHHSHHPQHPHHRFYHRHHQQTHQQHYQPNHPSSYHVMTYDSPYQYGVERTTTRSMSPFNSQYGSRAPHSSIRDMLNYDRLGYSYGYGYGHGHAPGRMNTSFGGIRCNGY